MFVFLAVLSASEDYYPCDQGVLLYQDGTFESNQAIPEWSGKWDHESEGVFCPPQSGNYYFQYRGRINTGFTFRGESWRSGEGFFQSCDTTTRGDSKGPFYMTYGKCETFKVRNWVRCSVDSSPWHSLKYRLNNEGNWLSMTTVARCKSDQCVRTRYGSDCSKPCDSYCHNNGYCDWGMAGYGGCICSNFTSDQFCEDVSRPQNLGFKSGLSVKMYDSDQYLTNNTLALEETVTLASLSSITQSYKRMEYECQLLLPQNGDYQFRVIASNGVSIVYNDKAYGSLTSASLCEPKSTSTSTGDIFYSTRRLMTLRMKMNSGCALFPSNIKIQWRNGRLYSGISGAPWEDYPERYVFNFEALA